MVVILDTGSSTTNWFHSDFIGMQENVSRSTIYVSPSSETLGISASAPRDVLRTDLEPFSCISWLWESNGTIEHKTIRTSKPNLDLDRAFSTAICSPPPRKFGLLMSVLGCIHNKIWNYCPIIPDIPSGRYIAGFLDSIVAMSKISWICMLFLIPQVKADTRITGTRSENRQPESPLPSERNLHFKEILIVNFLPYIKAL